jgi:hypothetical protein
VRYHDIMLDVPEAADGTGDMYDVRELCEMTVQVAGSFTANVNIQGRIGNGPLTTIETVTGPGFVEVPRTFRDLAVNVSGHSGGQPVVWLAGREARTE